MVSFPFPRLFYRTKTFADNLLSLVASGHQLGVEGAGMMPTTDRAKELTQLLKGYTTEAIVTFTANRLPDSLEVLLADRELAQRQAQQARSEQHELDLKLIAEQVRWMKFSLFAGVASALVGVILGWFLQRNWPIGQGQNITPTVQSQASPSTAGDGKEKAKSVPSKPDSKTN